MWKEIYSLYGRISDPTKKILLLLRDGLCYSLLLASSMSGNLQPFGVQVKQLVLKEPSLQTLQSMERSALGKVYVKARGGKKPVLTFSKVSNVR